MFYLMLLTYYSPTKPTHTHIPIALIIQLSEESKYIKSKFIARTGDIMFSYLKVLNLYYFARLCRIFTCKIQMEGPG